MRREISLIINVTRLLKNHESSIYHKDKHGEGVGFYFSKAKDDDKKRIMKYALAVAIKRMEEGDDKKQAMKYVLKAINAFFFCSSVS